MLKTGREICIPWGIISKLFPPILLPEGSLLACTPRAGMEQAQKQQKRYSGRQWRVRGSPRTTLEGPGMVSPAQARRASSQLLRAETVPCSQYLFFPYSSVILALPYQLHVSIKTTRPGPPCSWVCQVPATGRQLLEVTFLPASRLPSRTAAAWAAIVAHEDREQQRGISLGSLRSRDLWHQARTTSTEESTPPLFYVFFLILFF